MEVASLLTNVVLNLNFIFYPKLSTFNFQLMTFDL